MGSNGPLDDGPRRALFGTQLLSQAILEHRPAFKILNLVMGLESMLLERLPQSQGFAWRGGLRISPAADTNDSLCGRGHNVPMSGTRPRRSRGSTITQAAATTSLKLRRRVA
jgi:hypothetical protein